MKYVLGTVAAVVATSCAGYVGTAVVHDNLNARSGVMETPILARGAANASGKPESLPEVALKVDAETEGRLRAQGIRIDGHAERSQARTNPRVLFTADGVGPEPTEIPVQLALLRLTDLDLGQLVDIDGEPVTDPGPGTNSRIERRVENRLVWLAVYEDAPMPFGQSPATGVDENGQPVSSADVATPEDESVQVDTVDLYVLRDALTGRFLEGGSL